eukprot:5094414-Amphidinium_carterae.2
MHTQGETIQSSLPEHAQYDSARRAPVTASQWRDRDSASLEMPHLVQTVLASRTNALIEPVVALQAALHVVLYFEYIASQ